MRIYQNKFNVRIGLSGNSQRMLAEFFTADEIVNNEITIENVVVPEGCSIDASGVTLLSSTEDGRKLWGISVYYEPQLPGISSYKLIIRNETYHITAAYSGNQVSN